MLYFNDSNLPNIELINKLSLDLMDIDLKIGIDTGITLCRFAKNFPNIFFIGIEVKKDKSNIALDRVKRLNLNNVCIINMEALEFIKNYIDDNIINTVHIYFPTPNPKTLGIKHSNLKHRLICDEFTLQLFRILKSLGNVKILTDRIDYYYHIQKHFSFHSWLNIEWISIDLKQIENYYIGTPTEVDFVKNEGRLIYPLQYLRLL